MGSSCVSGGLDLILGKISLLREWSGIGGVKKMCRHGTSGYGLVGMVVLGGWLDLIILEVFFNL